MASAEEDLKRDCLRHECKIADCPTPIICLAVIKGEMPEDPVSPMMEAFGGLHEMYLGHIASGFNSDQALYMTMCMVLDNPGRPPKNVSDED